VGRSIGSKSASKRDPRSLPAQSTFPSRKSKQSANVCRCEQPSIFGTVVLIAVVLYFLGVLH
jgi:hypothetical protein